MSNRVIGYLSNPKRFTLVSLVFLAIILAVEVVGVYEIAGNLPGSLTELNARTMLTSLISFDGVFFGFSAIVFSSLVARESSFERISYIFSAMIATVILFVLSVVYSFFALASVGVGSQALSASSFSLPLGFMIYGISVFFFMIYVHVARSKQAYK